MMCMTTAPQATKSQRLEAALDAFEDGVALRRAQLQRAHPELSTDRIDTLLVRWLREREEAPCGDASRGARPPPERR